MPTRTLPLIGIPSCVRSIHERAFHTVNERYTSAVIDAVGGLPVLIPAIGPKADCGAILDRLDGILLTGSPSNVEPTRKTSTCQLWPCRDSNEPSYMRRRCAAEKAAFRTSS